ncbi:MAG: TonB-dependent receptor [Bacteroidota bacterium]
MKKIFTKVTMTFLGLCCSFGPGWAQGTTISGKVIDEAYNDPLAGVNIIVKGKVVGTISDPDGNFQLNVDQPPPFTLVFSFIGFETQEIEVTSATINNLEIYMKEQSLLGQEIVVSASRVEESILESPVTVEKMDILSIQQTASPDFYDGIANLKGVHISQGSLNFTTINTRGFGAIANERFVQLIDGMDNSAPLLNFPTGNLTGFSELDAESLELVPGAASALYGPNAFNGILLMNSKSPFEYQGLSAQAKIGATSSDAQDETNPMYNFSLRYAKAFNNKWAFKVNLSLMEATDWLANDYTTDRVSATDRFGEYTTAEGVVVPQSPNFDGINLYGDETNIPVPLGGTFGTLDLRRTGFTEEQLIDDLDASSLKYDAALHYRINDQTEASVSYRFGGGNSIYIGQEKYALRDFNQQFFKAEIKSDNYFVRAYMTTEDAGDSYVVNALGGFTSEAISLTESEWAPAYGQAYVLALQGYIPGVPAGNIQAAHAAARAAADAPLADADVNSVINTVRNNKFQSVDENGVLGARLVAESKLYHGEFNYNFSDIIDFAEIQVGGNFRRYDLFSDGTIFNESPEGGENESIVIDEFGFYTQIKKAFIEDKLKIQASIRYDKNENFDGQSTPRISAVYEVVPNHNIRASYQTGFRNPQTQAQFIYFPTTTILLGSAEGNAERYGIHNGGAYTEESFQNYVAAGSTDESLLEVTNIDFVQPEQLTAYEIGYKGLFGNKLMIDINYYHNIYKDFIAQQSVRNINPTEQQGEIIPALTAYRLYVNSKEEITSDGFGLGFTYNLPSNFVLSGNYSYATFETDASEDSDFQAGFNTPENRFNIALSNRKLLKNLGFNIAFRYQEDFLWENSFGVLEIPAYGTLDAQITYKIPDWKTLVKVGGTNLGGGDYRTSIGAPFIGQQYFISLTFDEFLN